MLSILIDLLKNCQHKVVLNGQFWSWVKLNVGVPQWPILGPLLLLIYINELPNGLQSNLKLFADDTSLFSTVQDITTGTGSHCEMILQKSLKGQYNGKWVLILIPANKLKSYYLAKKTSPIPYPSLKFNDNLVHQVKLQKHLGLFLDSKFKFYWTYSIHLN